MAVIHVPTDYNSLQEAVDAATLGSTIVLEPSFTGNGATYIQNTGLTIEGLSDTAPVILVIAIPTIPKLTLKGITSFHIISQEHQSIVVGGAGTTIMVGGEYADFIYDGDIVGSTNGDNDVIVTDGGTDGIRSAGGIDHIDGGSDIDSLLLDRSGASVNLAFNFTNSDDLTTLIGNGTTVTHICRPSAPMAQI
jgi:hypothetical protein